MTLKLRLPVTGGKEGALRFLADENVETAIVAALRTLGHDVLEVGEAAPGIDDEGVLRLARRDNRILITNDKDFGELLFLQGRRVPGVLLVRLQGRTGARKAPVVAAAVQDGESRLLGRFLVVEANRVRSRSLR